LTHKVGLELAVPTVIVGFTVTSTVNGVPAHPFTDGVTEYLTTPTVVVVLVNVCAIGPKTPVVWFENPVTLPDCKAAVQVKVAPLVAEFKATDVDTPLHLVCAVADPVGIGFTVIIPVAFTAPQPPANGIA